MDNLAAARSVQVGEPKGFGLVCNMDVQIVEH